MDVPQAHAFLAVAEELHFGRAAARLQMAQPPLSRQIKQLERHLGAELFLRSTRRVELTSAGAALVEPARRLLETSEDARRAVGSALAGETGSVRLGFAGASTHRAVGRLAQEVRRRRPGLHMEVLSSQFSHVGLERVLDSSLDLAIGRWDFIPEELDSMVIAREQVLVAIPSDHRHADEAGPIDIRLLRDDPWLSLPSGAAAALPNRLLSLGRDAGFSPRIVQTAPYSSTLLVLVAAGLGCALTLDSVRDNAAADGVAFRPPAGDNPQLEVRLLWRRDDPSPALHAVVGLADVALRTPARPD